MRGGRRTSHRLTGRWKHRWCRTVSNILRAPVWCGLSSNLRPLSTRMPFKASSCLTNSPKQLGVGGVTVELVPLRLWHGRRRHARGKQLLGVWTVHHTIIVRWTPFDCQRSTRGTTRSSLATLARGRASSLLVDGLLCCSVSGNDDGGRRARMPSFAYG